MRGHSSPLKDVCHCFAEAVRVILPDENTASAKQWHTVSGNRYFFNGLIGRVVACYGVWTDAMPLMLMRLSILVSTLYAIVFIVADLFANPD